MTQKVTNDEIIHEEYDDVNKVQYYKNVQNYLKGQQKNGEVNKQIIDQEMEKYRQSFREFFYTYDILNFSKNNDFYEQIMREVHPTVKIKGPSKMILKNVCKIFVQQLAQTCIEVMDKSDKQQLDVDIINQAYNCLQKRKQKKSNISSLFNHMY